MEFPISRERLQNYRVNEALSVQIKQSVNEEIKKICKDIEKNVLTTNSRKYVYKISSHIKFGVSRPQNCQVSLVQSAGFLKELIVEIKNVFPDCDVIVDPLETYIIIDWS